MTIRGIAAVYLLFVLFPVIAAIILFTLAAKKRRHHERMHNPDYANKYATKQSGRIRRFFTGRK